MNSITRNLFGHMRICLCKNNVHLSKGVRGFLAVERCTINLSLIIHRKGSICSNKDSFHGAVGNLPKCAVFHYGHIKNFTPALESFTNLRSYCTSSKKDEEKKPLSLFQKFKALYRDYWYVLVPVHMATSVVWFGGFYYMAKSGVDIIPVLEQLRISETIIDRFRSGNFEKAGYFALALAFYKLATPFRYAVTLGGTTVAINYLKRWGFIKPIPSNEKLKEMCLEQKQALIYKKNQIKENVIKNKNSLIDKRNRWNHRVNKAFKDVGVSQTNSSQRTTKRNVSRTKKDSNGQKGSTQE